MKSRLTNEELKKAAAYHRNAASFNPTYNTDRNPEHKVSLMATVQTTIAEVYEELVAWREGRLPEKN